MERQSPTKMIMNPFLIYLGVAMCIYIYMYIFTCFTFEFPRILQCGFQHFSIVCLLNQEVPDITYQQLLLGYARTLRFAPASRHFLLKLVKMVSSLQAALLAATVGLSICPQPGTQPTPSSRMSTGT